MTLILSCITDEQAFQVSDRRLTRIKADGSFEVAEDNRNKAVAFDGRLSWAFTGLARIRREPSAKWLATQLHRTSKESLSELGDELAKHATEDFKRIPFSSAQKRHAFVAVGWWPTTSEPREFKPVIVTISNATDGTGRWHATASDTFSVTISEPEFGRKGVKLLSSGRDVSEDRLLRLRRKLARFIKRDALHASGELLVREVRNIASKHEDVGSNVMLISLPRSALDRSGRFSFINQLPSKDVATYWYFSSSDDAQRSPIVVGDGMIGEIVTYQGAAARREMKRQKLPTPTPPRFFILTPWTITGEDSRRGPLVTEYKLEGWTDLTGALSWDKDYACPYFGLIIGANATDTIIEKIRTDDRHVILADTQRLADQSVSDELIAQLERWLSRNGATRDDLAAIDLEGHRETSRTLIDRLLAVMRMPRRGHEETKLHRPPSGTGTALSLGRKYQTGSE